MDDGHGVTKAGVHGAKLSVPLAGAFALAFGEGPADADGCSGAGGYPTGRLPKGLVLLDGGEDLAGEGVGLGVPILKRGLQTVFPGGVEVSWRHDGAAWELEAVYDMCLVERMVKVGGDSRLVTSRALYAAKDALAALHRRFPRLRGLLTATSLGLRRRFGWTTAYEDAGFHLPVTVRYAIRVAEDARADIPGGIADAGEPGRRQSRTTDDGEPGRRPSGRELARLAIGLDLTGLAGRGFTEIVVMNELGARHFDRYEDSDGRVLRGGEIGTWDEVTAAQASFVSTEHHAAFSLGQVEGARLWRGRELVGSRLAWTGFGYSLRPDRSAFSHELRIERASMDDPRVEGGP